MPKATVPYLQNFIIDPILPTREIHLIAGGSGAGKSTFAGQIASDLMAGTELFGYSIESPQKIGYLAFDRSLEGMRRTFERSLGTTKIPFPFYSTITSPEFADLVKACAPPDDFIKRFLELHPETQILFVDGIGMAFSGDSSSLSEVAKFVHRLVRFLHRHPTPLTMIALHHMGKQKKGNEYAQARARLHGSVAWAATCETCILIEPEAEEDPQNPHRIITLCPRNAPERIYTYAFDEDGRLIPAAAIVDTPSPFQLFEEKVKSQPEAFDLTFTELELLAQSLNISRASCFRYIPLLVENRTLIKVRRGVYQRLGVSLKQIVVSRKNPLETKD